jgi:hypothetical protein
VPNSYPTRGAKSEARIKFPSSSTPTSNRVVRESHMMQSCEATINIPATDAGGIAVQPDQKDTIVLS